MNSTLDTIESFQHMENPSCVDMLRKEHFEIILVFLTDVMIFFKKINACILKTSFAKKNVAFP